MKERDLALERVVEKLMSPRDKPSPRRKDGAPSVDRHHVLKDDEFEALFAANAERHDVKMTKAVEVALPPKRHRAKKPLKGDDASVLPTPSVEGPWSQALDQQ